MSDFELFIKNTVFFYSKMTDDEKVKVKNSYEEFKESEQLENDLFMAAFRSKEDMTNELNKAISNKNNCKNMLSRDLNDLSMKYTGYGYTYIIGKDGTFTIEFYNYYKNQLGTISEIKDEEIIKLFNLYNFYQKAYKTEQNVINSYVNSKTDISYDNDLDKTRDESERTYNTLSAYIEELKEIYNVKTL